MKYVMLGNTGIEVSRLCFGSLTVGPCQTGMSVEAGAQVLARAIELGVNFTDTAQMYKTYPYIRRAMELSGKCDLVISTKTYAYTRELAIEAVEEARRELDRDYIDIFMLHEQESALTLRGHADALEYLYECKAKGIIRAVGLSTHHVAAVRAATDKRLDVVHPILNVDGLGIADGTRADMEQAVRDAHEAGLGVFTMKAFGGGNLFRRAEECLDYIMGLDYVDSVAIGMQSTEEAEANATAFDCGKLPCDAAERIRRRSKRLLVEDWCEGCGNCVKRCGQKAMSVVDGRAVCDSERCVLCGYCSQVCPQWCLKII